MSARVSEDGQGSRAFVLWKITVCGSVNTLCPPRTLFCERRSYRAYPLDQNRKHGRMVGQGPIYAAWEFKSVVDERTVILAGKYVAYEQ